MSVLLSCGAGCQDSGKYAVSGKASTLGLGGEFTTAVRSDINARVGLNMLDFDIDEEEIEDIEYDIELDFSSFSALADWYVFNGSFRISGGVISMDHEVDLRARGASGETEEIGDIEYDWDDIGTLSGCVEIDDVAPYVGIGWGNPLTSSRRWGFTCDLGVAFTSSPDVKLSANALNPAIADALSADLEKERKDIEDDLDKFELYPVIAVSFFYRF
ncbi:MAG TPA: hypothetical protein DIU00_22660 [Phycisphaerales bacterium]|nr:hypothetical protein [Phycisphaerales bacterium]